MTLQQQRYAKITFVALLVLGVLTFVFFKVLKPLIDKRKEDARIKETQMLTNAQNPDGSEVPAIVKTGTPTDITIVAADAGIGGLPPVIVPKDITQESTRSTDQSVVAPYTSTSDNGARV